MVLTSLGFMKSALSFLAAGLLFGPQALFAQDLPHNSSGKGFYATLGIGAGWAQDSNTGYAESTTIGNKQYTGSTQGSFDLGAGLGVEAGVGYDFGNNMRGELTYLYSNFSAAGKSYAGVVQNGGSNYNASGSVLGSGTLNTNSVMLSGYYDFKSKSKFTPYLGGGIGYTAVAIPSFATNPIINGTTYYESMDEIGRAHV